MATGHFGAQRKGRVNLLKKSLFETLLKDDGGAYLAKTGLLIQGSNLRGQANKKKFESILATFPKSVGEKQDGEGVSRFWTKRLCKDSIAALVSEYSLEA